VLLCLLCLQRVLPPRAAAAATAASRGRGAAVGSRLRLRGGCAAAASDSAGAGADPYPVSKQLRLPALRTPDGQPAAHAAGVAEVSVLRLCASAATAFARVGVSVLESAGGFILGVLCQLTDGLRDFVSVYVDGAVAYKDGGLYGMLMWAKGEWDRADEDEDDEPAAVLPVPGAGGAPRGGGDKQTAQGHRDERLLGHHDERLGHPDNSDTNNSSWCPTTRRGVPGATRRGVPDAIPLGRGPGTRDEGEVKGEAIEAVREAPDDETAADDGSDGSETAAAESEGDAAWTEFVQELQNKLGTDIDKGECALTMQPLPSSDDGERWETRVGAADEACGFAEVLEVARRGGVQGIRSCPGSWLDCRIL
jgi:hypothetical protein